MPRKTRQNSITSDEKTAKINKNNLRLKDDFLAYLVSTQRRPSTISGYDNDLLIIFTYILDYAENKDFTNLTKREISALQSWMINNNGNSPSRVRRLKSAMSSLSNYIQNVLDEEDEYKDFRPIVRRIENPAMQHVRKKTIWKDEELDNLLDKLSCDKKYKQACVLALAMFSGRRKSELPRFRVSDFVDENLICGGALYKTTDPIETKGFGLGKFLHCYTLAKRFKPYLDAWLNERERLGVQSEWLFPDLKEPDNQMNPNTLNGWANNFSQTTGADFYWHSLRHYFTTHLVKAGLPDSVVIEILGWSSADMVKIYTDLSPEEQIAQYFDDNGEIRKDAVKSISEI